MMHVTALFAEVARRHGDGGLYAHVKVDGPAEHEDSAERVHGLIVQLYL